MWNQKTCKPPPHCELKTSLTDADTGTLMSTQSMFQDESTATLLTDHLDVLTNEHYILSRFIYKIKNQFRREKSLSGLQQINTCIKRLHDMDMNTLMTKIKHCFDMSTDDFEGHVYLISRQTLEFCLVRLMGAAALLAQTENYCQSTFKHVMQHLNVGHLIGVNVILFAGVSRIWYVTKSLRLKVCEWYKAMFNCHSFLPATQVPWLTDDTILPVDLTEWLTMMGFSQNTSDIDSEMVEYLSSTGCADIFTPDSCLPVYSATEDIGEVVSRGISLTKEQFISNHPPASDKLSCSDSKEIPEESSFSFKDSRQTVNSMHPNSTSTNTVVRIEHNSERNTASVAELNLNSFF